MLSRQQSQSGEEDVQSCTKAYTRNHKQHESGRLPVLQVLKAAWPSTALREASAATHTMRNSVHLSAVIRCTCVARYVEDPI